MNQEVKAEWIKRLRSGTISQAKHGLARKYEGGRCCLGVLCDIAVERNAIQVTESRSQFLLYGAAKEENFLPAEVRMFAELDSDDPKINAKDVTLSWLNDHGITFTEIADLIDQNL